MRGDPAAQLWLEPQVGPSPFPSRPIRFVAPMLLSSYWSLRWHRSLPFETGAVRGALVVQLLLESQVGPSPFPFETGAV